MRFYVGNQIIEIFDQVFSQICFKIIQLQQN